jgi:hypothetical protein
MKHLLLNNSRFLGILAAMAVFALPLATVTSAEQQDHPPRLEEPQTTTEPSAETLPALRQRYGRDATGVRARLGMCRRGHGGHGKGCDEGRGKGHGPRRGQQHRCPLEEQQGEKR